MLFRSERDGGSHGGSGSREDAGRGGGGEGFHGRRGLAEWRRAVVAVVTDKRLAFGPSSLLREWPDRYGGLTGKTLVEGVGNKFLLVGIFGLAKGRKMTI